MTKSALKTAFRESYWVLAEISEMKVNYSGHCYLELIEKEDDGDSVRAKARATIWAATFRMLKPYFETATNIKFAAGIKLLVKVSVDFHEVYGFSLNINDIEPSYTIGDAARRRQEIINRLKAEGVYEMNKALEMPVLPKRIAIISSNTAAGYGDFMNQMQQNPYGYTFSIKLFPAVMQGDAAEQSVVTALEHVFEYEQYFDVVVIIKGVGSQSDLACFNSYWMEYNICQFPIPVLTGIGHEQDETIADLVAHTRLKTPTAVAEYIISIFREADERLNGLAAILDDGVRGRLETEKGNLERHILLLKPLLREMLTRNNTLVKNLTMDTARIPSGLIRTKII
jgi:exodeoxyribonuclease VII large subunit